MVSSETNLSLCPPKTVCLLTAPDGHNGQKATHLTPVAWYHNQAVFESFPTAVGVHPTPPCVRGIHRHRLRGMPCTFVMHSPERPSAHGLSKGS